MRYVIARYKAEQREMAYRIFVTDCLRITTENTADLSKEGSYISKRYYDIINPAPVDDRTGDEIVLDIISRAGLEVK